MTKKTVNNLAAVLAYEKFGGWLVEYEHGASGGKDRVDTYLAHCETAGDAEAHAGGNLLFYDEDDFKEALRGPHAFARICRALSRDGTLPQFRFFNKAEYEIDKDV